MNSQNPSARLVLSDDGELLDGIFCVHCGQIGRRASKICEHCGEPFPAPVTALRLRLEALRQSEEKRKESVGEERKLRGLFYRIAFVLVPLLVLLIWAILMVARSGDMRGYLLHQHLVLGCDSSCDFPRGYTFRGFKGEIMEGLPDGSSGRLPGFGGLVALIALVSQINYYFRIIEGEPERFNLNDRRIERNDKSYIDVGQSVT